MMAIPNWAVEALMRGVGSVVERVPPERIEQMKQRAGQWLDELPQSAARGVDSVMRGARAGKEIIDRWAKRHTALVTPVINASGRLMEPRIQGVPIGIETVEMAAEALASPPLISQVALERLHRRLNRCCGDGGLSVLVTNSVDAACLAVGMTSGQKPLYMHRSQSLRLASGTPIPEAFVPPVLGIGASEHVHEVGSVEGFAESDCVLLPKVAMLLAVDHGAADPIWFKSHPCEQVTRVVLMMACGGIRSEHPETADQSLGLLQPPLRAAADWLTGEPSEVQADLVIVAGDGTLGGPPCGLIVGRSDLIDSIARSSIGRTVAANVAITAMMTHALEAFSGGDPTLHPVRAMLQTGEGNLRSRAERLATRLSGDESIRNCQIAAEPALLSPTGPWRIASRQLRLQHHSKSAQSWADQLLHGVPAVLAGVSDDALIIDLRWVPPCDDGALCATILGQTLSNSSEQGATEPNQTNDLRP